MRWLLYAAGAALILLGFAGLVKQSNPVGWAWWFGGAAVAHDAILVPLVLLAGWALRRVRWAVRAAAIVAGTVTLATLPTVLALGRRGDNPSILPLDYGRNLLLVLAALALAALLPRLWTRTGRLGLLAGLVSGVPVVSLMAVNDMIDAGTWALFLAHAALLGAVLAALFGTRLFSLANALAGGLLTGLLAWAVWSLTVLPVLLGGAPHWTITPGDFRSLAGEVLLGGITGVLLYVAPRRREQPAAAPPQKTARVVVVGGGFGGLAAARRLDRLVTRGLPAEVTLISDAGSLLFTPMLAGAATGALEPRHISVPVRAFLSRTTFLHARVESVDTAGRTVRVSDGTTVPYDQLVYAVGSIPSFHDLPGLAEHAFTLKTTADATRLRHHVLDLLDAADLAGGDRRELLTFVVAGGGFAGSELIAELFDLVHGVLHRYPGIRPDEPRFVLVHSGERILPELSATLGAYAHRKLTARGIEIRLGARLSGATSDAALLKEGEKIGTRTIVWTAGNKPHPLTEGLPAADGRLRVPGREGVWAIGDCARVLGPDGVPYPPTAQHALRQGRTAADNVAATLRGGEPAEFRHRSLGTLVALGRHTAVAEIRGLRLSGFLAWAVWRAVYLAKLPGLEKKLRVLFDWSLDLAFPRDIAHD
ncbi:NAD(P)/FAD-dependent oxidoreductase [Nonomuraea sp. NPDC049504]|uniref:NAD(P)/FAD-dependent oxidoreductase n=1 Tax=Nonomuraea sp. NPDC049504 TaxID=3154729 RepID=UPI0034134155